MCFLLLVMLFTDQFQNNGILNLPSQCHGDPQFLAEDLNRQFHTFLSVASFCFIGRIPFWGLAVCVSFCWLCCLLTKYSITVEYLHPPRSGSDPWLLGHRPAVHPMSTACRPVAGWRWGLASALSEESRSGGWLYVFPSVGYAVY
jgi:hypothetical protein